MTIYHIPDNEQIMNELYVVLSSDENGEGIVSAMNDAGGMPLVFGHARMIPLIKEIVKKMEKETGKKLIMAKFKRIENVEEF
jgi:hypothetical protein